MKLTSSSPPRLAAESLKVERGNGAKLILNGNSTITFQANQLYHLTGPSGAGKSTLLWTLARLYPLTAGVLALNGQAHRAISAAVWRTEVALLPQKPVIFPGSVKDNLLYPFKAFHLQRVRLMKQQQGWPTLRQLHLVLEKVGLDDIVLDNAATSLSGGQQARLALTRLLFTQPQVILADEPLAGVDETAARQVLACLHDFCQQGGTVVMTSHSYAENIKGLPLLLTDNAELHAA